MTSKDHYRELTQRLLESETWGTLSAEEEDSLLGEMDSVWWAMTDPERDEADAWLASQRARVPEDVGLTETPDRDPSPVHRRPRAVKPIE